MCTYIPYMIVHLIKVLPEIPRVGQNHIHTQIQSYTYRYTYISIQCMYSVFLAGKSPDVRSYAAYIYIYIYIYTRFWPTLELSYTCVPSKPYLSCHCACSSVLRFIRYSSQTSLAHCWLPICANSQMCSCALSVIVAKLLWPISGCLLAPTHRCALALYTLS